MRKVGTYVNKTKAICDEPIANIMFNGEKLTGALPIGSKKKIRLYFLPYVFQPSLSERCKRRNKRDTNKKGKSQGI